MKNRYNSYASLLLFLCVVGNALVSPTVSATEIPEDRYELFSSFETAPTVFPTLVYDDLTIHNTTDVDYYKLQLHQNYLYIFEFWNFTNPISVQLLNYTQDCIYLPSTKINGSTCYMFYNDQYDSIWIEVSGNLPTYYSMQINRDYDDNANGHDINSFLPLSYNEPRTGFKLYQDDWYRFYVNDHDFNLTVFNIEGLAEHPSYNMEFYYYNQTELLELPILANHHQALFFNNMNYVGYVYLKIMACPPYLLKNYDLIVHPYLTDEPEEPNSFRSQATPLGSDWDDFMANHSYLLLHLDTDWYSFTTTRSGQLLQVYMLFSTSRLENSEANNISVSFQLFNSKGELLANAIESMFTRVINITINESGQYYLRVSSPNNHRFGYIMFMEELFIEPVSEVHIEPNVYGEGIEITLCARSLPTNGHIEIYRDSQLLSNSTFTIPYRPSGGNYTMNLFFDGLEEGRYQYTVLIYATNDYCYNWFDGRELYSSPLLLRREFILTVGDPPNSQDDQQTDEIIEDDENQEDNNILEDNKSEDSGEDMINGYGYLGLIFGIGVIFVSFHLYRKKIY